MQELTARDVALAVACGVEQWATRILQSKTLSSELYQRELQRLDNAQWLREYYGAYGSQPEFCDSYQGKGFQSRVAFALYDNNRDEVVKLLSALAGGDDVSYEPEQVCPMTLDEYRAAWATLPLAGAEFAQFRQLVPFLSDRKVRDYYEDAAQARYYRLMVPGLLVKGATRMVDWDAQTKTLTAQGDQEATPLPDGVRPLACVYPTVCREYARAHWEDQLLVIPSGAHGAEVVLRNPGGSSDITIVRFLTNKSMATLVNEADRDTIPDFDEIITYVAVTQLFSCELTDGVKNWVRFSACRNCGGWLVPQTTGYRCGGCDLVEDMHGLDGGAGSFLYPLPKFVRGYCEQYGINFSLSHEELVARWYGGRARKIAEGVLQSMAAAAEEKLGLFKNKAVLAQIRSMLPDLILPAEVATIVEDKRLRPIGFEE